MTRTRFVSSAALAAALTLCSASSPAGAADAQPAAPATHPSTVPATAPAKKPPVQKVEPTLKVGMAAPKLSFSKFVKGEPVTSFEKGKVYIVEFWATWCGPCKATIPHVTEFQKKYKDQGLVVVGFDIWEPDLSKVEPFVKEMGDKMGYAVAIDEPVAPTTQPATKPVVVAAATAPAGTQPASQPASRPAPVPLPQGRMALDWMRAAGQNGIPTSFIVDREGKIAWLGHPMRMTRALTHMMANTFDPKVEADLIAKVDALDEEADEAAKAKEYDKALKLRAEIVAIEPEQADSQRFAKFVLLQEKGDAAAANALAAELVAAAEPEKDAMTSGRVAVVLLSVPGKESADKALALRAALKAYEWGDKSSQFARLLAQAYAANKDFAKAVEFQTKVVDAIQGPLKARDMKTLEEYKTAAAKRVD